MFGLGIAIAFLIIVSLISWCLIGAKGNWLLKLFLITTSVVFTIGLYNSIEDLTGWSTKDDMPEQFLVHWALTKEPNKFTKEEGSIYFWVSELDENHKVKTSKNFSFVAPHAPEPRTYNLPYTEELHKQVASITKMLKQGKQVVGKGKGMIEEGGDDSNEKQGDKKGKGGNGKGAFSFSQEQKLHFYELPPPKIPEKIIE